MGVLPFAGRRGEIVEASRAPAFVGAHKFLALLTLPLALAACGSRSDLTPPPGQSLPPKPIAAEAPLTAGELMEPSTQARPGRSDELLKQSEKRDRDEFDLPPG